ncbi:MAG: 5' nucleotidase, NT5C type [Acidimicrobiia bacterium]
MSGIIQPAREVTPKTSEVAARQPIIAVTLDNVCFEYSKGLRQHAAEWIRANQPGRLYVRANNLATRVSWFAPEWGVTPEEFLAIEQFALGRGFSQNVPAIAGAAETLHALEDAGYRIRYVTARPRILDVPQQTEYALTQNGFPEGPVLFVGDHFGSSAKSMVHADLFIDDAVSSIDDFRRNAVPHIIFDQPYNQSLGSWMRARSWNEVPALVERILGPAVVPPDRSFELYETEQRLHEVTQQLDTALASLADLRTTPLPDARSRSRSPMSDTQHRITYLERHCARLEVQLQRLETKRVHLHNDVLARDAFLEQHPEYSRPPSERDLEREARRLRVERDFLAHERNRLEMERTAIEHMGIQLELQRDELVAESVALDHERAALGLPHRSMPMVDTATAVPTVYSAYGTYAHVIPEISILLGSTVAQPCAEHEVVRMGYQIIGRRVDVRVGKSQTDIDILAMRAGPRGEQLRQSRAELLHELEVIDLADQTRVRREQRLRAIERELFLSVEVKWMTGSLSRVQQEFYDSLLKGGSATIIGELPDRGALTGITRGHPFASSALVVRVGHREWVARNESAVIRATREQQTQAGMETEGLTRVFAPEVPTLPPTAN